MYKRQVIGKSINKLAQLEDVMEEHDFNNIEDLQGFLNFAEKAIKEYRQVRFDRDTWQKACELACETMTKLGGDDCCGCRLNKEMCNICENKKALIDYFYQQAKKGNDSH